MESNHSLDYLCRGKQPNFDFFYSFLLLFLLVLFIFSVAVFIVNLSSFHLSFFLPSFSFYPFSFLSFLLSSSPVLSTFKSSFSFSSLFLPSRQTNFLRRQLHALFPPLTVLSTKALICIYSFRTPVSKRVAEDSDEESETDDEIQDDKESRNRFFKRSDSTLVLGKYFLLSLTFIYSFMQCV